MINKLCPSVFENSNPEDIISEAAQTENPLAVLDDKRKPVGVVSRSRPFRMNSQNSNPEDIISEAAQTENPLAVLDDKRKPVGVISRSRSFRMNSPM